jgi:hypothetical protein
VHTPWVESSDPADNTDGVATDPIAGTVQSVKDQLVENGSEGHGRFFAVIFKNELARVVHPMDSDPLQFDEQIYDTMIAPPKFGQYGVYLRKWIRPDAATSDATSKTPPAN